MMKLFISVWTNCNLLTACFDILRIWLVQNPDIPQAGRVEAHGGDAGQTRAELFANRTVRLGDNPFLYPPKYRRHVAWTFPQKHKQAKSYVNRWRKKTRGWQPVHHRFITGLSPGREALFLPGCWPVDRRLFVSVNPFDARNVREKRRRNEMSGRPAV